MVLLDVTRVICVICIIHIFGRGVSANNDWTECFSRGTMKFFRPKTEACCGGNIFQRTPRLEQICCGDQFYDTTTGACCAGKWYKTASHFCCRGEVLPHDGKAECCGGRPIDTSRQTCCQGRPVEGTGECCSHSATYDPLTQRCCAGADLMGHVHTVGRESVEEGFLECCGTGLVDTRRELCCRGVPREMPHQFAECCGTDLFDSRTEVCCEHAGGEHRVSPLVKGQVECCGLTPYNRDNDQCCNARVTHDIGDGRCCGSKAYNPLRSSCCSVQSTYTVWQSVPEIPGVQDCCRGESYLKTNQVCCLGRLHDLQPGLVCCGTELHDPSMSLCCGGQALDRPSPSAHCCGASTTFEPDRQTCCSGQVSDFVNGTCCKTGRDTFQPFDPATSKCCPQRNRPVVIGQVHSIDATCCGKFSLSEDQLCTPYTRKPISKTSPSDDAVCCVRGNSACQTFDSSVKMCKKGEGRTYTKPQLQQGQALCDSHTYQTSSQQCCSNNLQPRAMEADRNYPLECCGRVSYNPAWHSCQGNTRFNRKVVQGIPQSVMSECRGKAYNNKTHGCNRDLLISPLDQLDEELEVCLNRQAPAGYVLYDAAEKECCEGTPIGAGHTCCYGRPFPTPGTALGQGRCCDLRGYNPATHTCCDGEVIRLTAEGQVCCGRRLFTPAAETDICCSGRLYGRNSGMTECTDGVAHSPAETVCDGVIHEVNGGQCCGKALMDADTQICCQDTFLYDRRVHGDTCCGRVAYDSSDSTKKCCGHSLYHDTQQGVACCQSQLMDPASDTCKAVNDVSYTFPHSKSVRLCSEGGQYDAARQTCCGGVLFDFPGTCCGSEPLRAGQEGVMCCGGQKQTHQYGAKAVCCGGQVFDGRKWRCCGGRPLLWHHIFQTCCSGRIMSKQKCRAQRLQQQQQQQQLQQGRRKPSNLGPSLCGGNTYNASIQSCCGDTSLYDPTTSGCLAGLVKPLCGGMPYDNATLLCCAGATHNASTTGCCSGTAYDLGRRTCCAGRLSRVKNGACCGADGGVAYSADRYLCCAGRLRRRKAGRTECCGSVAYNPLTDTCCAGRAARGVADGTCCGDKLFDPAVRICCPETGVLHKRRPGPMPVLQDCCAPGTQYDPDLGTCAPQVCQLCHNLTSSEGWKRHLRKPTLVRGTVVGEAAAATNASHHVFSLDRVRHLDHAKPRSRLDSPQLRLVIPAHCACDQKLQPGKPYVVMSDRLVTSGPEGATLVLEPGDFLAMSKKNLGKQIQLRLCRKRALTPL